MTVNSFEEAQELHNTYRGHLVEYARYLGVKLALENGTVHARQVREIMKQRGMLHQDIDERWMGTAFKAPSLFVWTGKYIEVEEASPRKRGGGGGGRPIRVWKLAPGVTALPEPDAMPKPIAFADLEEPPKPQKKDFQAALDDLREMARFAKDHGFEFSNLDAGKKLSAWLRYQAAMGDKE